MMVNVPGPMLGDGLGPRFGTFTIVSASCISRLASLYGLVTRISSATPGSTSRVRIDGADAAGDADRRACRARQRMRCQVHLPDRLRDVLDLSGRGLAAA